MKHEPGTATAWYSVGSMMFAANAPFMLMLVSRLSGVEAAGTFGIATATAQQLYIIGLFGVNNFQMTDYQRQYGFRDYYVAKLVTTALMAVACLLVVFLLLQGEAARLCTVALVGYWAMHSFADAYQNEFFRNGALNLAGRSLFFCSLIPLGVFAATIRWTKDLLLAMSVLNVACVAAVYLFTILPAKGFDRGRSHVKPILKQIPGLLVACVPICLTLFFILLMSNAPKYVVSALHDDMAQGMLNILLMPVQMINLLASFIFKPLLQTFSAYIQARALSSFFALLRRQWLLILGMTALGCVAGWLFGPWALEQVFRVDMSSLRLELTITILGGGFLSVCAQLYFLLILLRKQKQALYAYMSGAAFCTALCFPFTHWWGIRGAALAFTLSYLTLIGALLLAVFHAIKKTRGGNEAK